MATILELTGSEDVGAAVIGARIKGDAKTSESRIKGKKAQASVGAQYRAQWGMAAEKFP